MSALFPPPCLFTNPQSTHFCDEPSGHSTVRHGNEVALACTDCCRALGIRFPRHAVLWFPELLLSPLSFASVSRQEYIACGYAATLDSSRRCAGLWCSGSAASSEDALPMRSKVFPRTAGRQPEQL